MYLSRVELDLGKRKTLQALAVPNLFHGAVESSFQEEERARNLWRIDRIGGRWYLLIQSPKVPDLSQLVHQFGREPFDPSKATKNYDHYLNRIETGEVMRFRLTANPTTSVSCKGQDRGKIMAHITPEYQKKWLEGKQEACGFRLDENDFDVSEKQWYHFRKKAGMEVTLLAVSFEGVLKLEDAEIFRKTLISGIGREKAYGMGLMTVIRVQ